jgi:hypothetical protein
LGFTVMFAGILAPRKTFWRQEPWQTGERPYRCHVSCAGDRGYALRRLLVTATHRECEAQARLQWHLQLLRFIGFSAAGTLALRTLARARAIEALAAVTRSLAPSALA